MKNNKLVAIIGPTASGKTDIAIKLAKQFNGEIVCADSRTIYRGMDIGTAKPFIGYEHKIINSNEFGPIYQINGVNHYMIDICDPKNVYTVAEFVKLAKSVISNIFLRGKTPFLVGGSGLYIDAILQNFQFPKFDVELRKKLELKSEDELTKELIIVDPISVEKYQKNKRRLIRALEVYLLTGKPISKYNKRKTNFQSLILAIDWTRSELYKRIDDRVDSRIKLGMIEEVENLHTSGLSWDRLESFGLEYRYIAEYLKTKNEKRKATIKNFHPAKIGRGKKFNTQKDNDLLKQEMIQVLKFKIHAFARRQLTWFRKNKEIVWVKNINEAKKNIKDYLY